MDELIANTAPTTQLFFALLGWILIGGGVVCLPLLLKHHRAHPPNAPVLTQELAQRSWSTQQVGMLLSAILLLYLAAACTGLFFYEEQLPLARLLVTFSMYLLISGLVVQMARRRNASAASGFGFTRTGAKKLWLAPIFYLALLPLIMVMAKIWHLTLEYVFRMEIELQDVAQVMLQDLSLLQIGYMLTAIVLAPIYEEVLFRGILFPYLIKRIGLLWSTLAVSLIFSIMHFHAPSLMPLFLLSGALCLAYWRTGTLWISIGMHITFNAVSILVLSMMSG